MKGGTAPKELRRLLHEGAIIECEPLLWGSNDSFVVRIRADRQSSVLAIYKPRSGERPLWDFPRGTLFKREYASYLLCEALGWRFIPPTVIREGPYGIGSLQLYIQPDPQRNYGSLKEKRTLELQRICLFDVVANNADRKAGHCFQGVEGSVWGIDHGLTFHPSPKLRTVIWDFAGESIPENLLQDIGRFLGDVKGTNGFLRPFRTLLAKEETRALLGRLRRIAETGRYPHPDPEGWNVPWSFY